MKVDGDGTSAEIRENISRYGKWHKLYQQINNRSPAYCKRCNRMFSGEINYESKKKKAKTSATKVF